MLTADSNSNYAAFSDMRGYLYANTASEVAWNYSDPVDLISELEIRGTFVARAGGETGKFALHRVKPGEESASGRNGGSTAYNKGGSKLYSSAQV